MKKLKKFIIDNSLLLAFTFLFACFLAGQVLCGASLYNQTQALHGMPHVGYWRYIHTGHFLQGMFANWQAAILQLASLIIFAIFLRQWGAPHSLRPGEHSRGSLTPSGAAEKTAPRVRRRSKKKTNWFYANSLSIVFVFLFVVAFVLHLLSGAAAWNAERALSQQGPLSIAQFAFSSKFWFETLQTWEAEYMAIALYILLSIFLRQQGSPESKPTNSPDSDTGDTNK